MKITNLLIILSLLLALTGSAVQAQEAEPMQQNIFELLDGNPEFSILTTAIETTDLENDLTSTETNYTVFAPTDTAFENLLSAMDITQDELLADEAVLTEFLSYHIVPDVIAANDIDAELDDQSVFFANTLYDASVSIDSAEGSIFINGNALASADTMASNGVIHALEAVLIPPGTIWETVETFAKTDDDSAEFTILMQAIQAADLDADFATNEGSFTVFAPTDVAFRDAAEALNLAPSDLLQNPDFVTDILLAHVVEGEITSVDLIGMYVESGEPISLPTISSEDDVSLEVSIDDDGLLVEDARITTADILTRNGVIHVIDRVLLPASD